MDEKTLNMLTAAAKACGIDKLYVLDNGFSYWLTSDMQERRWNPLNDNDDMVSLISTLKIGFIIDDDFVNVYKCGPGKIVDIVEYYKNHNDDVANTIRFAIVRAASLIG